MRYNGIVSNRTTLFLCLVLGSIGTCGDLGAAELVSNGDFDSTVVGWRLVGRGALAHNGDGMAAPGSLELTGGLAGGATQAIAGQCLSPVSGGQQIEFSAMVRVAAGSPASCRVALFESEHDDCTWIVLGAEVRRSTFSSAWHALIGGNLTTAIATRSVELRLHCANAEGNTAGLQVRFDDVSVNTVSTPSVIFVDDFETGDSSRWSSKVP